MVLVAYLGRFTNVLSKRFTDIRVLIRKHKKASTSAPFSSFVNSALSLKWLKRKTQAENAWVFS